MSPELGTADGSPLALTPTTGGKEVGVDSGIVFAIAIIMPIFITSVMVNFRFNPPEIRGILDRRIVRQGVGVRTMFRREAPEAMFANPAAVVSRGAEVIRVRWPAVNGMSASPPRFSDRSSNGPFHRNYGTVATTPPIVVQEETIAAKIRRNRGTVNAVIRKNPSLTRVKPGILTNTGALNMTKIEDFTDIIIEHIIPLVLVIG